MHQGVGPTPFADVNAVLEHFRDPIQTLLGHHFVGMYVIGSLALGDFDSSSSDIDFVVVTDTDLGEAFVRGLQEIHEQFAASSSPWAARVEAVYAPQAALHGSPPTTATTPQIEKGTPLQQAAFEPGWVFQCWTLREHGGIVAGPNPKALVAPIEQREMDTAVVTIAREWLDAAHQDPSWIEWLRQRPHHIFVIQTLCRLLYSLAFGAVTSKPQAVQWAQHALDKSWADLIQRSLVTQPQARQFAPHEVEDTVAFIQYTLRQGQAARPPW